VTNSGRHPARRFLALLAVLALAFTACSSGGDDDEGTDTTDTTEAAASDPNAIIRVGYDLVQQGTTGVWVDPAAAKNNATANDSLFALVYGRFLYRQPDGELTPELAESVTIVDKNTLEIKLREGLTFSDGSPFDAAAVKAGLERNLATNNIEAFQEAYFSLKSIDVVDPTTVKLNFPGGTAAGWFDVYIDAWQTSIVKAGETDFAKPAGAGPMVVESFADGVSLKLRKSDTYWNKDKLTIGGYDFVHIAGSEPQSGISALRAGQIDVTTTDPSQLTALSGSVKSYARISPDQVIWLHMCKRDGPLANAKVRKAINQAIDRDAINEAIFQGTAEPSTQMWPTGHRFNKPELDDELAYDPESAKALLEEAGFGDGFSLDIYPIAFGGISETAEVMKQQLGEVGITLNIKGGGMNYVNDYLIPEAAGMGMYPGNAVGSRKLDAWSGDGLGNVCKYRDADIDRILGELSAVSASTDEAVELWHEAADKVIGEALGGFVLFRSTLGAYDDDRVGDMESLQLSQYIVPNPTKTFIKAG
jgi:peptide/nickel transport system substrate-binding protein